MAEAGAVKVERRTGQGTGTSSSNTLTAPAGAISSRAGNWWRLGSGWAENRPAKDRPWNPQRYRQSFGNVLPAVREARRPQRQTPIRVQLDFHDYFSDTVRQGNECAQSPKRAANGPSAVHGRTPFPKSLLVFRLVHQ